MAGAPGSRAAWPDRTSAMVAGIISPSIISFRLDAAPGDGVGPTLAVARGDLAQCRRRGRRRDEALRLEGGLRLGLLQDGDDLTVETLDDVGRRSSRREEAVPHVDIDALEPAFGERRHLGQLRPPLRAAD